MKTPAAMPIGLTRITFLIGLVISSLWFSASRQASHGAGLSAKKKAVRTAAAKLYAQLPQRFEPNHGQFATPVKFATRGNGYTILFGETEAVMRMHNDEKETTELRVTMVGANQHPRINGREEQAGRSNYLHGQDASRWITNVPAYTRLAYDEMWPGINVEWYGNQQQLEYDFIVAPKANARQIKLAFSGQRSLRLDRAGALVLQTDSGEVRMLAPQAWQSINGVRQKVDCRYRLTQNNQVAFTLGAYDHRKPLVIDPVLIYATLLGGFDETNPAALATDANGNLFLTGYTYATDWPGTSTAQANQGGSADVFVVKLNASGTSVLYSTWIGGSHIDFGNAIDVDATGNAYIAGLTFSEDFPKTAGAFQTAKAGETDGFILKLNAAGSALLYATYLGGSGLDAIQGLAIDSSGNAYMTGATFSFNFPTAGAQTSRSGSAVHKSSNNGTDWIASAQGLLASSVSSLAFDPASPSVLYGAAGATVYRSTDGGRQWNAQGSLSPVNNFLPTISALTVNATGLYLLTNRGVYKSTDGGLNFVSRNTGLNTSQFRSIVTHPQVPATLYVFSSRSLYRSTNGGDSWFQLSPNTIANYRRLAFDSANPQIIYLGTERGVLKTSDNGLTWSSINNGLGALPPDFGPYIYELIGDPIQPNTAYLAIAGGGLTPNTFWKTTDGGVRWTNSSTGLGTPPFYNIFPTAMAMSSASSPTIYLGTQFGIWKSSDRGATWNLSNQGLQSIAVNTLLADGQGNVYAGVNAGSDAFVTKLNASGSALQYSRYLGGTQADTGYGIAVNANGEAVLTGGTRSANFPTVNALQPANASYNDAFITKLNASGSSYLFSTYLGGNSDDEARGLALDSTGDIYLTGSTYSNNFPIVGGLRQNNENTQDAFVTKINANGSALVYSTYLGGNLNDSATGIAVESGGGAWVVGSTRSTNFPVASALQANRAGNNNDVFITRLNPAGSSLLFSTYYGGQNSEQANAIALDNTGNAFVTGLTFSTDFPVKKPLAQLKNGDGFLLKLARNADLALIPADVRNPVQVNTPLAYAFTITNLGPDEAIAATFTDTLPGGITFVSATTTQGSCTGTSTVTCNLGNLAANAQVTVTLTVRPVAAGALTNRASITSVSPDLDTANNAVTQESRASTLPSIAGRVVFGNGTSLGNATMGLSGAKTATASTNANGFYQFGDLAAGSYTVTPALTGYVFNPPNRAYSNLTQEQTANFTAVTCSFTINPTNRAFQAGGGTATITLTGTDPQCPWTTRSNVPWITLTSAASGNGSATITFVVAAATAARSGTLTIAGKTFTVWQEVNPCAVPDFITAKSFPGGKAPQALVSGDFNKDGKPDLAVGNDDYKISILLGEGNGRFSDPVSYASYGAPREIIISDFNSDGRLDLAATLYQSDQIVVLLGLDGGRFANFTRYTVGNFPSALAAANFNGDNKLDLVVANEYGHNISVLLGNGTGNFATAVNYGNPHSPTALVAGEFTGDGKLDIVVTGSELSLMAGNGNGGFGAPVRVADVGIDTRSVMSGDFNRDGRADLALLVSRSTVELVNGNNQLAVLLANASGGFRAPIYFVLEQKYDRLSIGDLNGDNKPDLLAHGISVTPLLGDGGGGFGIRTTYTSGLYSPRAVINDFTGDGKADVVTASAGRLNGNGLLALLTGDGSGKLAAALSYTFPSRLASTFTNDFNGDGKLDLVALSGNCDADSCASDGEVYLQAGDGIGGFNSATRFAVGNNPSFMEMGDFNNDNRPDLVVANQGSRNLSVLLNNNTGGFNVATTLATGEKPYRIAVADFNNDNRADLLVSHFTATLNQSVYLYLGNGSGGFASPSVIAVNQLFLSIAVADLNGDGRVDVLASNNATYVSSSEASGLYVMFGNGNGTFGPLRKAASSLAADFVLFDFTNDGKLDVAASTTNDKLIILQGDGAGNFIETATYSLRQFNFQGAPHPLVIGDFNNDARPDIAVADGRFESVNVFLGTGKGEFSAPASWLSWLTGTKLAAGDFNRDGRTDLAVSNLYQGNVVMLLNRCAGVNNSNASVSAASYTRPLASESIAALFGTGLANATQIANTVPLPTTLAGVSVTVRDSVGTERAAPLFFVSPAQINYLVPVGTLAGGARVTVTNANGIVAIGTAQIETTAPNLFTANASGQGVATAVVLRVRANGTQVYEAVSRFDAIQNRFVPIPIDVSNSAEQVYLVLFGTGLRDASSIPYPTIGTQHPPVLYAGPQGSLVGLDQVNIQLNTNLIGAGEVDVMLQVADVSTNTVKITFK